MTSAQLASLGLAATERNKFVRRFVGSDEAINGGLRYCAGVFVAIEAQVIGASLSGPGGREAKPPLP